jgi:hypothetical protein
MVRKENDFLVYSGMQRYAALFLFIGFYLIGLPSAYLFMYVIHMNIFGFWVGMILAEALTNTLLFILIWNFDWNALSEQVQNRICFASSSIYSKTDSLSSLNIGEHMLLLPYTSDQEYADKIGEHSTIKTQSDNEDGHSNEKESDESLFKLIGIKLLVLVPLVCLFILSMINSFK